MSLCKRISGNIKFTICQNQTYVYDLRGNRIAEIGKKESREYVYDETNRLVEGTNWKGDKSAYTYNGLGVRISNTHTTHSGSVYDRDYVIDYTSLERDDLMVYAEGNGQLEYVQREVYAGSERIEQFTDRSRGGYERLLYVHEDLQGNTRYYTKATGQSFAELTYDAWGMPESPNKLLNNDHGNYVYATYTGHIFDTTLDIYFCEARFYDASTRTWMAMDPVKDGGNWYQYCYGNPLKYWDPLGMSALAAGTFMVYGCNGVAAAAGISVAPVAGAIIVTVVVAGIIIEWTGLDETIEDGVSSIADSISDFLASKKKGENKKGKGKKGKEKKGREVNDLGDADISDLDPLPKNKIDELGGEDYTQALKRESGKSKSDLYWDEEGNVYAVPKKGGPPQWVDFIPRNSGG